ncbi:hypothetical protein F4775DRAFT_575603 [Biscogniauxia sp. FL1348]|nr:hypothetical protein F4775DRAFT_575603 [Biscogniauxia sp. FL1348]
MVHKAVLFQLFSLALVCPFTTAQADTENRSSLSSQDTPAVRDAVRPSEEASGLPAKREPLVAIPRHEINEELPSVKEIESFIESAVARPVEKRQPKRKKKPSSNSNSNSSTTSTDDDESGADRSTATVHISLVLSAVVLAGLLQL